MGRNIRLALGLSAVAVLAACSSGSPGEEATDDNDLTSLTARQRVLTFEGAVFVEPNASDAKILEAAHKQTQTAFGALLASEVAVQSREVQNLTAASLRKRPVKVIDVAVPGDAGKDMLEVRYTYKDNAVVPVAMARKTSLSLALLGQGAEAKQREIVANCTKNDHEAQQSARDGLLWYDFNPSKATCRREIEKEQRTIDEQTGQLTDQRKQVPKSRAERVFLPVTMSLARADTAERATYPEYDRLFGGNNVREGALTITMVNGRLAHHRVEARKDGGYYEWMSGLEVILNANPDFQVKKVEPDTDITSVQIEGRRYDNLGFKDFIRWTVYGDGWPAGMPTSSRDNIAKTIADKLDGKWITFEKKVKVSQNDGAPKDLTIRIETMFGADEDPAPHRRALKNGDVVVYNGHSYIGYGPLDPGNFRRESFPGTYQIFWFDSCVSYNYYEKDFFLLKEGGSKTLDMITNGLEAPEYLSGEAEGKFVAKFIDGSMPSYQTLLQAAKATDSLRVVDGEIDNRYDPARTRLRVTP